MPNEDRYFNISFDIRVEDDITVENVYTLANTFLHIIEKTKGFHCSVDDAEVEQMTTNEELKDLLEKDGWVRDPERPDWLIPPKGKRAFCAGVQVGEE